MTYITFLQIFLRILLLPVFLIGMIVFLFLLLIEDFQEHWIRAEKKQLNHLKNK